jgi:heme-degrading monooxygenase HmoA
MGLLIVRHKVADFAQWKVAFDGHAPARAAAGLTGGRVYRSLDDPNETTIIFEFADEAKARAFTTAPDLREAMNKGGVIGQPAVHWLREA